MYICVCIYVYIYIYICILEVIHAIEQRRLCFFVDLGITPSFQWFLVGEVTSRERAVRVIELNVMDDVFTSNLRCPSPLGTVYIYIYILLFAKLWNQDNLCPPSRDTEPLQAQWLHLRRRAGPKGCQLSHCWHMQCTSMTHEVMMQ